MEKMRLMLDELAVQSFPTADGAASAPGTVHAHSVTGNAAEATCVEYTCNWGSYDQNSCDGGSCNCLSAGCDNSSRCPTGGFCWGTYYGSGGGTGC